MLKWLKRAEQGTMGSQDEVRHVTTNIYGNVIGSQILTSGGDINISDGGLRHEEIDSSDKVLFYQADHEILSNSGAIRDRETYRIVLRTLAEELRILVLAIPPEGCVVIPPTYYFESELCRNVLRTHAAFIDYGYVKLLTEYIDLEDYLARKRDRYAKAAHFAVYKSAYYLGTNHGVYDLHFQLTSKRDSIGSNTLSLWSKDVVERAQRISYSPDKIEELRKRVLDTERPSFLYENVAEHMEAVGIGYKDAKLLQIREVKNRDYLSSYVSQGIRVPEGSRIVSDLLVPSTINQRYNIQAWRRVYEFTNLLSRLQLYEPLEIIRIKMKPEISSIIAQMRIYFSQGRASDWVIGQLVKNNLLQPFVKAFSSD